VQHKRECLAHGQGDVGKTLLAIAAARTRRAGFEAQHMVGGTGQSFVPAGKETTVIKAMQHGPQHIQLFHQHAECLGRVDSGATSACGVGVFLHRCFQLIANADVIHHQATLFVFEHPVDAGNRLHQVVALHGLVHVQGVDAGRVKAGEPHVAHDHKVQRIGGVFEAFFQPLFGLTAVDVGAQ
jgi:hypothetical protein